MTLRPGKDLLRHPKQGRRDGIGTGRELDAATGGGGPHRNTELLAGGDHRVSGGVGDTGMQDHFDVGAGTVGGNFPAAGLEQRVGQKGRQADAIGLVEIAVQVDDVGHRHGTRERGAER